MRETLKHFQNTKWFHFYFPLYGPLAWQSLKNDDEVSFVLNQQADESQTVTQKLVNFELYIYDKRPETVGHNVRQKCNRQVLW